jgi:hypothetical protein
MIQVSIAKDADKQGLRDEIQNAVKNLTKIKNANSLDQVEVVEAVQYMAKVLLFFVKLFARTL